MYGNPGGVRNLGRRVHASADQTRNDAQRSTHAANIEWLSTAANRYRSKLDDAAASARATAGELDQLAQALMDHADAVQHRLDQIAAAEAFLKNLASSAWDEATDLASGAVHGVEHAASSVVHGVVGLVHHADSAVDSAVSQAKEKAEQLAREVDSVRPGDLRWIELASTRGWSG